MLLIAHAAASSQAARQAEEEKWAGVPDWKRKVIEEKVSMYIYIYIYICVCVCVCVSVSVCECVRHTNTPAHLPRDI